jgi:hypothetical protein
MRSSDEHPLLTPGIGHAYAEGPPAAPAPAYRDPIVHEPWAHPPRDVERLAQLRRQHLQDVNAPPPPPAPVEEAGAATAPCTSAPLLRLAKEGLVGHSGSLAQTQAHTHVPAGARSVFDPPSQRGLVYGSGTGEDSAELRARRESDSRMATLRRDVSRTLREVRPTQRPAETYDHTSLRAPAVDGRTGDAAVVSRRRPERVAEVPVAERGRAMQRGSGASEALSWTG